MMALVNDMPKSTFEGPGLALSSDGLGRAAINPATHAAEMWTPVAVETAGCGFLPDRRPVILFERHIFQEQTLHLIVSLPRQRSRVQVPSVTIAALT